MPEKKCHGWKHFIASIAENHLRVAFKAGDPDIIIMSGA